MFKFYMCVFVFTAAVSADYDFKDSDFNQLLFEDLHNDVDDLFEEPLRLRRDADVDGSKHGCHHDKGGKVRDFHCCSHEKVDLKQIELTKEVKKQCILEVRGTNDTDVSVDPFDCAQMQVLKEQMVCTGECIAKKFNLLNDQGKLQRDTLLAHLRLKIGDNKWKAEAVEKYVDKCLGELKSDNETVSSEKQIGLPLRKKCNSLPLQFTHCIWKEFVQGCPKELQIETGKCKKIRERLTKGDTSFLHKTFLHHLNSRNADKKDSV